MKSLAILATLLLCIAIPARAGSVLVDTTVTFNLIAPPGTTASGIKIDYDTVDITGLHLTSGPAGTVLSTDGFSLAEATFPPASMGSLMFTFGEYCFHETWC